MTIDQIPFLTWVTMTGMALVVGVLLGQIIHERRRTRATAVVFFSMALAALTAGIWR